MNQLLWILRGALLAVAIVVLLTASALLSQRGGDLPAQTASQPPEDALRPLAIFAAAVAATLLWGLSRAGSGGGTLMLRLFLAVFGVMTVVAQMDSLAYLRDRISDEQIARFFLMGLLFAAALAPLAVMLSGRLRAPAQQTVGALPGLAWKLPAIAAAYLVIYYFFGYYVAWQEPAVREFYGSPGAMRSFWGQLRWNWDTAPWMPFFQVARAVLWVALMLPLLRVLHMGRLQAACFTGVFFAVWSLLLLLPNPLMPPAVARAHLVELLSSNLLFGLLAGALLAPRVRDSHEAMRAAVG